MSEGVAGGVSGGTAGHVTEGTDGPARGGTGSVTDGVAAVVTDGAHPAAARIIARLRQRGESVGAAESLTGGLVTAALTSVPGSSEVVRGGVVAYAPQVKATVLGVDPDLLAGVGPVDETVAAQMAEGARQVLGATYAVATTGEAGPESASGQPVGTVRVAVAGPDGVRHAALVAGGDRWSVRAAATEAALALLEDAVGRPAR